MKRFCISAAFLALALPAVAQEAPGQPPQVDLQIAIGIYQQKLAGATDEAVAAESRVTTLMREVVDLRKKVDETSKAIEGLKAKDAPKPAE
jgi:predicted  nucleic acid-binding Zn-ribbon protein